MKLRLLFSFLLLLLVCGAGFSQTQDAVFYYNRGRTYFENGDYYNAMEDYDRALQYNPDYAEALNGRGEIYFAIEEYMEAEKEFNAAIRANPGYYKAYENRGRIYQINLDYDRVITDWVKALEFNPALVSVKEELSNVYLARGLIIGDKGNLEGAVKDFTSAIEINPEFAEAYFYRANAYGLQKNWDLCIRDFEELLKFGANEDKINEMLVSVYETAGVDYYEKTEFDKAILNLTKAVLLNPQRADSYYNRGLVYSQLEDFERAVSDFSQAVILDPAHYSAYGSRGLAYYRMGEPDKAIDDYNKAIDINLHDFISFNNRGNAYREKGEFGKAIDDFTQAVNIKNDFSDAYYNRGLAYSMKGDSDNAIADYSQAIRLNPKMELAYNNRGKEYIDKNQIDTAILDFSQAIKLNPRNEMAYLNRGLAYSIKNEYNMAIADFTQLIIINPFDADAYCCRGVAYASLNESEKAKADYAKAISIDPNHYKTYYNRGILFKKNGDIDKAIADLNQAVRINPEYEIAYQYRGVIYADKGDHENAIADFTYIIELNPGQYAAYYNRALEYLANNEPDKAIHDFTQSIILNHEYIDAYISRANAYIDKKEIDMAIADLTRAITLDPKNDFAYNNRGNAYSIKGELDRAIADFTQAIVIKPESKTYSNRGLAYWSKGEIENAINDFTRAIALDPQYDLAYNNRGIAYIAKKEFEKGIADCAQAINLNEKNDLAFNNRGYAYYLLEDYDRAIADFSRAIEINPQSYISFLNRGTVYHHMGEHEKALDDYAQSINLNPNDFTAYGNRGNIYFARDQVDNAIAEHAKSISAANNTGNILDIFYRTWEYAGFLYLAYPFPETILPINDYNLRLSDIVREALALSIAKAEKARTGLGSRGAVFMESMVYMYYAALDFESFFGTPERAFEVSEGLRSRGFLEQMSTEIALRLPGIETADAARVRELSNDISNLQQMLSRINPQFDPDRYAQVGLALVSTEEELAALDFRITEKVPRYAEFRRPRPKSLKDAKEYCGEDTAMLVYAIWDSSEEAKKEFKAPSTTGSLSSFPEWPAINSYCLIITKDGLTPVRLDPHFDYTKTINDLRTKIFALNRYGEPSNDEAVFESERNALYNALIKPAIPYIPQGIKNILIIPDGALGHLPFDILRENKDSPDFGETYRLSLSPSVTISIMSQRMSDISLPIIAFGGAWYDPRKTAAERGRGRSVVYDTRGKAISWLDLDGTEEEVKKLEQFASGNIRTFFGRDVSEENVKQLSAQGELAKYPIIHFATHGYFKEDDLERAGIVLSEVSGLLNNDEDGYLTIPEIALLDLNARMVLLSACETGLGILRRGDGMTGMVRAFMIAGADNVGASLWEISDDGTLEFMTRMYGKVLNEGLSFREAYYLTKNEFRYHEELNHPFYWAAFMLYM